MFSVATAFNRLRAATQGTKSANPESVVSANARLDHSRAGDDGFGQASPSGTRGCWTKREPESEQQPRDNHPVQRNTRRRTNGDNGFKVTGEAPEDGLKREDEEGEGDKAWVADDQHPQQRGEQELYSPPLTEYGDDVGAGHARGVDGRNVMRPTVWQQQVKEATHGDET